MTCTPALLQIGHQNRLAMSPGPLHTSLLLELPQQLEEQFWRHESTLRYAAQGTL